MIMKNGTKGIHRLLGLLLALTMLLSLVAPVLNVAYAQPDEGIGSESVEEAAEEQVPEPHEEEALPVEDTETEEQEEETEPVTEWEDPVSETEDDVTPDPETEDETEEPDVTEDAVEEEEETEEATEEEEEEPEEHPGENPDHVVPDDSPYGGEINYGIYPETPFGRFPFALNRNMFNMAQASPTEPGEVKLFKVATPVEGMVNTWDVTLRIEGRDKPTTSDIVLVIDTSGSMNDYGRMAAAKAAANKFVDELLPSDNTRIGVVSFASEARTRQALTNNATNLHAAINALSATGGTHTQAGVKQAQALLANSDADNKHIVLLSDGEPTYSYQINNPNNYLSSQYIAEASSYDSAYLHNPRRNRLATTSEVPESQFRTERVGAGTAMFHRYSYESGGLYYNHGNSAIAQAGFAKANSRVWTIALSVSTAGQGVLNQMASPNSYFTAEPADLETIFQNIAGQIGSAVKDATVSDAMGGGFYIPGGVDSVTVSQGSVTSTNGTLNWNPGTLTTPIADGSDIRYAEMTYRVEITDDILNQTPDEEGKYPTNSSATIVYTDADGNPADGTFPVPTVDPILLSVAKVLKDDQGNIIEDDEREFAINITNNNGYNHTYLVKAGETIWLTNLRQVGTYTVTELGAKDYEPTIVINGNVTNTFTVEQGDPDIEVVVTNKKPTVKVEGEKTWDDADNQDGKRPESITIRLFKQVGETKTEVDHKIVTMEDGWKWSFTDLPKYEGGEEITYTITEDSIDGYTTEVNGYDVTNTHEPSKININVTKVWKNTSTYPESVTIKLLADSVDTGKTLELTEENNWTGTFKDLDEYSNGEKIEYTISEVHLADYETTYSGDAKDGFVVTNTRIYTPPTGINLDFLPYVLLLAVAGVGIGATILRKRKNEA